MGKKDASSSANFKKAALSLLENKGKWASVPSSLKGGFTCKVYCDNPAFIVSDESHFIGAYLTPEAFDKYRAKYSKKLISASEGTYF